MANVNLGLSSNDNYSGEYSVRDTESLFSVTSFYLQNFDGEIEVNYHFNSLLRSGFTIKLFKSSSLLKGKNFNSVSWWD